MGFQFVRCTSIALLLANTSAIAFASPVDDASKLLLSKGLIKVGNTFELDVDVHLADRQRAIRAAEAQLANYGHRHQAIQNDVNKAEATVDDLARQMAEVDEKMDHTDKNAFASYNMLANQHNKLLAQIHEGQAYLKQRTEELNKLVSPPAPTNLIAALGNDVEVADAKYASLAADPEIAKALDSLGSAGSRVKLGPSDLFNQQKQAIRHQRDVAMKSAIKGKLYHNTLQIMVTLNTIEFPMIVDSGCSTLLITDQVAKKAGVKVDLSAPTASATTANGAVVNVHPTKIPTLTVGQFTLKDVPCDVLPAGVGDDCLLGGAFLQHFLYQIDLNAAALNLTPLDTGINTKKPTETPADAPTAVTTTSPAGSDSPNDVAALQASLVGTAWQWTPTETIQFNADGTVTNAGWPGLTTTWKVIDRRTVLLFIERGRSNDRYAILSFTPDASAYSAYGFGGEQPGTEYRKVASH